MSNYLHRDDARGDWVDHECSQGGSITKAEARWDAMIAKVKADALREAADEIEECIDWSDGRNDYGDNQGYETSARMLRDQAKEIEGEA